MVCYYKEEIENKVIHARKRFLKNSFLGHFLERIYKGGFTLNGKKADLHIKKDWCKGCNICVAFCPKDVLTLDKNGKIEIKDIDSCISCGLCELRCPDLAIFLGGTK